MREVLTNNIRNRDEIKRRIKNWVPDYLRCQRAPAPRSKV